MKTPLLFGLIIGLSFNGFAQLNNWCATDKQFQLQVASNPSLIDAMHEQLSRVNSGIYATGDREDIVIPVVVHVLHSNGVGNISDDQILSGLDMLNEDYNRLNDDADETRDSETAPFLDVASSVGIRFELAKIDPDGECTNGIQRRDVGSQSYNADNQAKHYGSGGLDAWDRNYYFNIWIVNSIDSDGDGVTLGYAEFPYSGGSSNYGVIIRNDAYGTIGTASGDRTLTHEVGHCLGLLHTFQGGCHSDACDDNGDYCCDTPPVDEPHWSCLTSQNFCDDIPSGDAYGFDAFDQFENYMSYSPCQNMFSEDQKTIILGNLSSIDFLSNLVDPEHNLEVGVGLPAVLCKAQFQSSIPVICSGSSITFEDLSYDNVIGWNWTFEGGTPSTSILENPTVTYSSPGTYNVTLEVTDGVGSVTSTSENYVIVLSSPGTGIPYSENFEDLVSIPDNNRFLITDEDQDDAWMLSETVGYSGTHCAVLENRGNTNNTLDEIISGPIDLSSIDPDDVLIFNFKYAYKKRNVSNDEWLRFYISKDCGETWALRKNIHGDDLSEEIQNSVYIPESNEEWVQVDITNIFSDYFVAGFRYKFQFENDRGNNIYIDDINLFPASMTDIEKNDLDAGIKVYPNPVANQMNIEFNAESNTDYTIQVYNALGELIETVYSGQLFGGANLLTWNAENLTAGMYIIQILSENQVQTVRVIKD